MSIHAWSIATQSEAPSSCPTRSPKPARVRLLTLFLPDVFVRIEQLYVAVPLAQLLLVDLADARFWNAGDEQDLLGNSVFGNDALVGKHLVVRLHTQVSHVVRTHRRLDDPRERPLAPTDIL